MTIETLSTLFTFIGGLGMFIYGMNTMADGLQKSAGNKMKQLLGFLTNNRLLGVLVGAAVTAIIQSSSATTVMVVGFVNAGIINLTQAVGVIMGANIGTTVTAWLVSMNEWGELLKPEFFAPVLIGIGAFTCMFAKKKKNQEIGQILVGFGVLFVGLSFMSGAIKPYRDSEIFTNAFTVLGKNPLLGILVGTVVTAIIQSSSASVGILQTLAMNGMVNWNSAIFITLGQNIGTCITAILSSAGANKTAKRAAAIHLIFNVIGTGIFGLIMFIVFLVNKELAASEINMVQISMFHTIFNVTNTILLFPLADLLVKISGFFIDDSKEQIEDEQQIILRHLDDRILETPSFAVENVIKEVIHMGEYALENVKMAVDALLNSDEAKSNQVITREKQLDSYDKMITEYLIKIANISLNEKQHFIVNNLFYTISNIERIGDHAENLAELTLSKKEGNIRFTKDAYNDLKQMCDNVISSFDNALNSRKTENLESIQEVVKLEESVDSLEDKLREKHIQRLLLNECNPEIGVIYIDALVNLERISDHSLNIANYVRDEINFEK